MTGDLFSALAQRAPHAPLLHGLNEHWSAADVLARIELLRALITDVRVLAVHADNSPAWALADLACLRASVVHVPLPTFFSPAQTTHVLSTTAADALLTDQPSVAALLPGFTLRAAWCGLQLYRRTISPADQISLPSGTAKIAFTSGSTGTPKGVCLSAAGLMASAHAIATRLSDLPITRHLCALPLALLLENVAGLYAPILQGAQIFVPPLARLGWRGMAGFDPAALHAQALAHAANSVILVPEIAKAWALYLDATPSSATSLIYAAVGGAHVDAQLIDRARARGLPLYQGYGLTECGSVICLNRPGDDGRGTHDVGRPLDHVQVRVQDGEVIARTAAFLGYLHSTESLSTEFATGDLGELDEDGHLHLTGRRKNLLITSFGRNVSPEWIETPLLADPLIAQAIVLGDARPSLVALIVLSTHVSAKVSAGDTAIAEHIERRIEQLNATLPDYARLSAWALVPPFTAANEQATANARPKRSAIAHAHAALIDSLYAIKDCA
jgi:long-chain acyl-CoA synthetase